MPIQFIQKPPPLILKVKLTLRSVPGRQNDFIIKKLRFSLYFGKKTESLKGRLCYTKFNKSWTNIMKNRINDRNQCNLWSNRPKQWTKVSTARAKAHYFDPTLYSALLFSAFESIDHFTFRSIVIESSDPIHKGQNFLVPRFFLKYI